MTDNTPAAVQEVQLEVSPGPTEKTLNLAAKSGNKTIAVRKISRDNLEARHHFANSVGLKIEEVSAAILQFDTAAQAAANTVVVAPAAQPAKVCLRGMHEPKALGQVIEASTPFEALRDALAVRTHSAAEPVIEWDNVHEVAVLDVDFHDLALDQRPSNARLRTLALQLRPQPSLWWPSHGQGLHLVYVRQERLRADELAACAALTVRVLEPDATWEIMSRTRHPAYARPGYPSAGSIETCPRSSDGAAVPLLRLEVAEDRIQEWLAERHLAINGRYSHDRCPVDPSAESHGEPVLVGEKGISCFKCQANSICRGSRRPGWFPYAALVEGGCPNRLRTAAWNFTHWEHAQHIMAEDVGITGEHAQLCYTALMKMMHSPDDPRINEALFRGEGLVRADGYWVTSDLARSHNKDGLVDRLAKLPVVQRFARVKINLLDEPGLTVDPEKLGVFRGVDDLSRFGYPRVEPVRGMKVAFQLRPSSDPGIVRAVVPPDALRDEQRRQFRPRYVPLRKRMPLPEAMRILAASFPGINENYVKLLIAARGCAEGGTGQPPMIAVDGPSGSGKSGSVLVAAVLVGDNHRAVPWTANPEHFLQKLYEASSTAGLVSCDEIVKLSSKHGNVLEGLNGLLTFTPGSLIRKLYVGPVMVQQVPAIIITDVTFPQVMFTDEQLGRRFVHVHLERKVAWQQTANRGIAGWRALSPEHAAAGNAIASDVIDRYFAHDNLPVFEEIASDLGFSLMIKGGDMGLDPKDDLLDLFRICCSEEAVPANSKSWKGRGWKQIKRDASDPLSKCWLTVCDNPNDGFFSSRRVKETDWASLLGADKAVECDINARGQTVGIRFRIGHSHSPKLKVNGEIAAALLVSRPTPELLAELPVPSSLAPAPTTNHPAEESSQPPQASGQSSLPVFIDLETRSACDLKVEGGPRYASHHSTEILSVVALLDGTVIVWTPLFDQPLPLDDLWPDGYGFAPLPIKVYPGPTIPQPLAEAIAQGRPLCAHNAHGFDAHIWRAKGLPEPARWIDTLPHVRAGGLPGTLDELGERLLGKGKDKEGTALMRKLSRPNERGIFHPLTPQNTARLVRYNLIDVLLLSRVYETAYGCGELDVIALDKVINDRGVQFDSDLAKKLAAIENANAAAIKEEVEQLTGGAVKAHDLRRDKFLQAWLQSQGTKLPNLQQATVQRFLAENPSASAAVRGVLNARLASNRITTSKLVSALSACDEDGRLRDMLTYHKAQTGRWAGRKMQPHNLPRPHKAIKDVGPLIDAAHSIDQFKAALPEGVAIPDALSALVRPCLRAAPGKVLCAVDFGSIEARGLAWCANEQVLLERFARGDDVYCELASRIFGRLVTPADKMERGVGKQGILGCGYSMGAAKFAKTCAAQGIDLAAAGTTAEAVVENYRDAYPAIAGTRVEDMLWRQGGLWKDLEAAAKIAILTGSPQVAGRCQLTLDGTTLTIQLPSGRRLFYRNARIENQVPAYCRTMGLEAKAKPTIVYDHPKMCNSATYGGRLTENIVQAISRDLLVEAMLECERQGLPVVLHVHDEIVIEVPEAEAESALRRLAVIMSTPPTWATGFPIEVEGFAADRYLKSAPKGAPVVKARNGQILG